jgi:hypothetical protein
MTIGMALVAALARQPMRRRPKPFPSAGEWRPANPAPIEITNPDRPRGNCRFVSDNSVFLSGDGVASAPLMKPSSSNDLGQTLRLPSALAGRPPRVALAAVDTPAAELLPAKPGPTWSKPGASNDWQPKELRWDANGYRISRLASRTSRISEARPVSGRVALEPVSYASELAHSFNPAIKR